MTALTSPGFFNNRVVAANNIDLTGSENPSETMLLDGQLLIAHTALNANGSHIDVGNIVAGSGVTVSYSNPNIIVSLSGGGTAFDSIAVDASTAPGTNPVLPTGAGLVTITGAQVATGTIGANVIRTDSLASNTLTIEIQRSTSAAAANSALNGVSHYDSASFSVAATGFVTLTGGGGFTWSDVSGAFSPLKNNGYFITGTATGTLPAAPAQGDTIKFFVDHASQFLTIQATAGKIIRLGSIVSSSGGTFVSTAQGDSLELTYRTSDTCWCAIAGFTGTWTFT